MLASDVRFEGFTTSDWIRVLSLFKPRPRASEARDPDRPRGGIIAVGVALGLRAVQTRVVQRGVLRHPRQQRRDAIQNQQYNRLLKETKND